MCNSWQEQELYDREGLGVKTVTYMDNQDCIGELLLTENIPPVYWEIVNHWGLQNFSYHSLLIFVPHALMWSLKYEDVMWCKRYYFHFPMQICINEQGIEQVKETVFLGVVLDEHLSWKPHISQVARKISKSIGVINRARFFFYLNHV